jgi:radical SAM protein with 4Fe4S-binding SPASM domain
MVNPWHKIYEHPQSIDPFRYGIPDFALYVDIELTNDCNLNCLFCVRQQMTRPIGFMKLELFKEICRQLKKYNCLGLRFLRWGEPLLNKNIFAMLKIAKEYGFLTHITTNGLFLEDDAISKLIELKLDSINVSMQGLTEEEYNSLRRTSKYSLLESNLKRLHSRKEEKKSAFPFVCLATTLTDETEDQVNDFINRWRSFVDDFSIGYTWFKRLKDKAEVDLWLKKSKPLPHYFRCIEVMCKLSIDWDGEVSPCCLDYNRQLSLGNVARDDLMTLWRSPKLKSIRDLLSQKQQDSIDLCSTCELNYSFRGKVD